MWGGPLAGNGFVIALLNRAESGATIRVNWSMLEVPAVTDKSVFTVTDVWTEKAVLVPPGASGFASMIGQHDIGIYRLQCVSSC